MIEPESNFGDLVPGNFSRIARESAFSRVHVSRVLRGKANPSLQMVVGIAVATGHSTDEVHRFIAHMRRESRSCE